MQPSPLRFILAALWLAAAPAFAQPVPLPASTAIPLLGHALIDREGQEIGRIVDIIALPDASPRAIVAEIGGFLGLGTRRIAVDWRLLRIRQTAAGWTVGVDVPGDDVARAPEYPGGAEGIPVLTRGP